MADFPVLLFAADNIVNPQNPGFLPAEDGTFRSDLVNGDTITWLGGGESALIYIEDNVDAVFDEALSNQFLRDPVTFDGVSYSAGIPVTPTYTIVFSGTGGPYTFTSFNFSGNTNNEIPDAFFWEGSIPPPGTVLTVTSEINPTGGSSRPYADFVTCFARGTQIAVPGGTRAVETIRDGDTVITQDGREERVLLACARHIGPAELRANPKLLPVRIMAGALGRGLPQRDLYVSRQHRLCVASPICERMFGAAEVLVSAIRLTELPGIMVDDTVTSVEYFHLLLADHEVIVAEGAPAESLYLGESALEAMSLAAQRELRAIFPDLARHHHRRRSEHLIPRGAQQKQLVMRHAKNAKPALC
ncbi:MAG: Hint domain-containing protein [Pseudomonadota bacterium]